MALESGGPSQPSCSPPSPGSGEAGGPWMLPPFRPPPPAEARGPSGRWAAPPGHPPAAGACSRSLPASAALPDPAHGGGQAGAARPHSYPDFTHAGPTCSVNSTHFWPTAPPPSLQLASPPSPPCPFTRKDYQLPKLPPSLCHKGKFLALSPPSTARGCPGL